jgi:hypothetical protein
MDETLQDDRSGSAKPFKAKKLNHPLFKKPKGL